MRRLSLYYRPLVALALGLFTFVAAIACSDTALPRPKENGTLSIQLKDAEGDIKHAVVTISQVYIQGGPVGRVVLLTTPFTIDLTTLSNQMTTLVDNAIVPNGTYSQLRFIITGAYIEVENADGTTSIYASSPDYSGLPAGATVSGSLQLSGEAIIGAPVTLPTNAILIRGDDRSLLVDFDVEHSFTKIGGALATWRLSPVLSATDFDAAATAIVTVQLDPAATLPIVDGRQLTLADFRAVISTAGFRQEKGLTDPDGDQTFSAEFNFLNPATYSITLTGPSGIVLTTTPLTPIGITVSANETKTQAFRILDVSGPISDPTPGTQSSAVTP